MQACLNDAQGLLAGDEGKSGVLHMSNTHITTQPNSGTIYDSFVAHQHAYDVKPCQAASSAGCQASFRLSQSPHWEPLGWGCMLPAAEAVPLTLWRKVLLLLMWPVGQVPVLSPARIP